MSNKVAGRGGAALGCLFSGVVLTIGEEVAGEVALEVVVTLVEVMTGEKVMVVEADLSPSVLVSPVSA